METHTVKSHIGIIQCLSCEGKLNKAEKPKMRQNLRHVLHLTKREIPGLHEFLNSFRNSANLANHEKSVSC